MSDRRASSHFVIGRSTDVFSVVGASVTSSLDGPEKNSRISCVGLFKNLEILSKRLPKIGIFIKGFISSALN